MLNDFLDDIFPIEFNRLFIFNIITKLITQINFIIHHV